MDERTAPTTRRRFLRAGALFGTASLAGCAASGGGGSDGGDGEGDGPDVSYDGWLDDVPNYDGSPVDRTGEETVTVVVGAGNGLLFEPAAVRVSTGTTVVWEWTGRGGQHNVKDADGAFESELTSTEGTTFERTVDTPGVVRYLCVPHQAVGMKGVVEVVDG